MVAFHSKFKRPASWAVKEWGPWFFRIEVEDLILPNSEGDCKKSFQDSLGNQAVVMKHHKGFEDNSLETGGLTTIELPTSCTSHVTVFEDCLVPFLRSARLNLEALGIGRNLYDVRFGRGLRGQWKEFNIFCRPFCCNMCFNLYQFKYGSKHVMIWVWNNDLSWKQRGSEIQIFNWRKITQSICCMVSWGRYAKKLIWASTKTSNTMGSILAISLQEGLLFKHCSNNVVQVWGIHMTPSGNAKYHREWRVLGKATGLVGNRWYTCANVSRDEAPINGDIPMKYLFFLSLCSWIWYDLF